MNHQRNARIHITRAAWAILCAAILIVLACAANFFTAAPKAISLLLEPISLLLTPGLVVSLAVAGPHDYSIPIVVFASLAFYTVFFFAALTWLSHRRGKTSP